MARDTISELLDRTEALHPDLAPFVEQMDVGDSGLKMLRHPLQYSVPHCEQMNALINARYAQTRQRADQFLASGEWNRFIWIHERPHRLDAFLQVKVPPEAYWPTLAELWTDTENFWQNKRIWSQLFAARIPGRSTGLMMPGELQALAALPEVIPIYRGGRSAAGLSWTVDKRKARWFATRWSQSHKLYSAAVEKKHVIAYFEARGEKEIVVERRRLRNVKELPLTTRKSNAAN